MHTAFGAKTHSWSWKLEKHPTRGRLFPSRFLTWSRIRIVIGSFCGSPPSVDMMGWWKVSVVWQSNKKQRLDGDGYQAIPGVSKVKVKVSRLATPRFTERQPPTTMDATLATESWKYRIQWLEAYSSIKLIFQRIRFAGSWGLRILKDFSTCIETSTGVRFDLPRTAAHAHRHSDTQ